MKTPIVLYRGPSVLDGAPIVCIATLGSSNVKTGPMVQTWIMRADTNPLQASADASDSSVCGQCPRRHSLGGDCYVTLIQAPRAVWANWDSAGRPGVNWLDHTAKLQKAAQEHGFRMGSYGDPAAVPWTVWNAVIGWLKPKLQTGYTHQWRAMFEGARTDGVATRDFNRRMDHYEWLQRNVMASVDTLADARVARMLGWRFFLAVSPADVPEVPERTVLCLAEREGDKARTCETCGICDGAQNNAKRASVYLIEHGGRSTAKHKRSNALKVMQ